MSISAVVIGSIECIWSCSFLSSIFLSKDHLARTEICSDICPRTTIIDIILSEGNCELRGTCIVHIYCAARLVDSGELSSTVRCFLSRDHRYHIFVRLFFSDSLNFTSKKLRICIETSVSCILWSGGSRYVWWRSVKYLGSTAGVFTRWQFRYLRVLFWKLSFACLLVYLLTNLFVWLFLIP